MNDYTIPFASVRLHDTTRVGGKIASLGEMIGRLGQAGVRVPDGFATTALAFREFLEQAGLGPRIARALAGLDVDDVARLAATGAAIRRWILDTPFQPRLRQEVLAACRALGDGAVAVRSSATAEDLPAASFAGQQETILNVQGAEAVLAATHQVFASLFNDRAIAYRVHQGFDHAQVAICAGVQHMVRSDLGASGVMFTLDTESGFRDAVFITAAWGLGELVVQGAVNPDEFYVYKPALRAQRHAILRRNLGSKASKMILAREPASGRFVEIVDVAPVDRQRFSIGDDDVRELARLALVIEE
ncbi:MAG: PEP/pyruvate-binding domain-containing protein, partial [Sphingomonadaceae bacterium]